MSDRLSDLRQGIDAVDAELTRLFEQRMALARKVGAYKQENGLPITDPARERAVLASRAAQIADPALADAAKDFFELLMRLSREEQARLLAETEPADAAVAYQGVPGAFGHQAALLHGGEAAALLPCRSFDEVFQAVSEGKAACGVLPLENSSAGSIADVYDLLDAHRCHIVGEVLLPVAHCLLALPGAKLEDIHTVYSHEQGFLQCKAYLAGHPGWVRQPHLNTAVSARHVAELGDMRNAAIASRLAAQCYGLDVLAEGIQTQAGNATRFVVVAVRPAEDFTGHNKATLSFALRHERGTLHRALAAFVALGMNLTRIESRPIPGQNWEYRFLVDIEGALSAQKLAVLVEALEADCVDCRVLGHYPAARGLAHEA